MALRFDVSGWCHERDRTWPDYHSQAEHSPWPMTHVFLRSGDDVHCWAAIRGGGGGSQQATFRTVLETHLNAAWLEAELGGWADDATACARQLEAAVQHEFVSAKEPFFASDFSACWSLAVTRGAQVAVLTQGMNRAFRVRRGVAEQLTADQSLYLDVVREHPDAPQPVPEFYKELSTCIFSGRPDWKSPKAFVGQVNAFEWQAGDALVLVTGAFPDDVTPSRVSSAVEGDSEATARKLYAALESAARQRLGAEFTGRPAADFLRRTVVVAARVRPAPPSR